MNGEDGLAAEKLVQIYQASDEWEGTILVGFLGDHGVAATLRPPSALPPFDGTDRLSGSERVLGISVLERDRALAEQLLATFRTAITDDSTLAETAAQHLRLDQQTIHRLRRELIEEKRTFEMLGWIGVVFLGAAAVLWAIWPAWLKLTAPVFGLRWVVVAGLVLGAVFVGNWINQKLR